MNAKKIALYGLGSVTMLGGIVSYSFYKQTSPVASQELVRTNLEIAIADMCKDDYIAEHIAKSKYPFELGAIASVESDCRPQIRGDNNEAYGLYQIQEKHWGRFNDDIGSQTRKAETVLDALVKQHGYERAIERYNGSGVEARLYKKKVLDRIKLLREDVNRRENMHGEKKKTN
jgi:hypothetical protein